jgi:HEAT repeat protein
MESLDAGRLADEAIKHPPKIRQIVSLLYNDDIERRFVAVQALGAIARREPELMNWRWERIFHSFDDTMSCWGAAEAIGEIARNMPQQNRLRLVQFLRNFRRDDCSRMGYLWGMCRICQIDQRWIAEFIPELQSFLSSANICIRGQALWALGELRIKEAAGRVKELLGDEGETWYYENDAVCRRQIKTIAGEALEKLAGESRNMPSDRLE